MNMIIKWFHRNYNEIEYTSFAIYICLKFFSGCNNNFVHLILKRIPSIQMIRFDLKGNTRKSRFALSSKRMIFNEKHVVNAIFMLKYRLCICTNLFKYV